MPMVFEWDPDKALRNVAKHGVTFREAATVFADPMGRIVPDLQHSHAEDRYFLLGRSSQERLIAVSYTERHERVRIISARLATPRERRDYEQH